MKALTTEDIQRVVHELRVAASRQLCDRCEKPVIENGGIGALLIQVPSDPTRTDHHILCTRCYEKTRPNR